VVAEISSHIRHGYKYGMSNTPAPSSFLTQRRMTGVNVYDPPQDILPHQVQRADNLYSRAGVFVTRPGKQGLLTTPMGSPNYAPLVYVRDDLQTVLLYTSGGGLWFTLSSENFATPHEILLNGTTHFNLNSPAVQIIRSGKYAYIVDGQIKLADLAIQSDNTKVASASHSFVAGDVGKTLKVTIGSGYQYTDLAIQSNAAKVASVARPFLTTDVGGTLQITSGTNFTPGIYTIIAVVSGIATLNTTIGTALATGGHGTFNIKGGLGFTLGIYTILSVSAGVATLNAPAGTANSTSGSATLMGPSYRISLSSNTTYTAEAVSALLTPDPPVKGSLVNTVLDALSDATVWSGFPAVSWPSQMVTNAGLLGASAVDSDPPPVGWQSGGDSMDFKPNGDGTFAALFDVGAGPSWVDWETPNPTYGTVEHSYTDLVAVSASTVTSAAYPFVSTDAGAQLQVNSGTNWIVGSYTILSVGSGGVASLSANAATVGATGGTGKLVTQAANTVQHSRVFTCTFQAKTVDNTTKAMNLIVIPESSAVTPIVTNVHPPIYYTDLAIDASNNEKITSAARPFLSTDTGKTITVTGGAGWAAGGYTILSVSGGAAILNGSPGAVSTTGGSATLGLDASATSWGNHNTSLQVPPSEIPGSFNAQVTAGPGGYVTETQVVSFTALAQDFDFVRLRLYGPGTNGNIYATGAQMIPVDVRLKTQATAAGQLQVSANNVPGGYCLGGNWIKRDYTARSGGVDIRQYTDLVVQANTDQVTSSARAFITADVGRSLVVTNGFDFTQGRYKITAVAAGIATLDSTIGTQAPVLTVSGATNALPILVTTTVAHGLTNGQYVSIAGALGNTAANGNHQITVNNSTSFYLNGVTGNGAWTSGGTVTPTGTATLLEVGTPDYSKSSVIAIAYSAPISSGTIGFRLGFQKAGDTAANISWTNPCTLLSDANGTFLSVDISTVSSVIRAGAQFLYLQITADLATTVDLTNLCTIGPISSAGNLSIGFASYTYVAEEVFDTAFTSAGISTGNTIDGQIESEGSRTTTTFTPNGESAQVSLEFAVPVNADSNELWLFRYGGSFNDAFPTARLIAKLPLWTDTLDPLYADFVTWDHVTRTVVDNTPDGALVLATTLATDRSSMLLGNQANTVWQNRYWTASDSTLAGSWEITTGQAAGLYFNATNDPNDPNVTIKGIQVNVGGDDNDPIQALIPLSTTLVILKTRSLRLLTGTSGANFELSDHLLLAGVGLEAIRAWALVENRLWFLGPDAVWEFDGGDIIRQRSIDIDPLIAPGAYGGEEIPLSLFQKAAMLYAGRRLYLFMPKDGDSTANDIAHVWDSRLNTGQGAWTRYLDMNVTSACTSSASSDRAPIYLAGLDGQMYQLTGNGDKALPSSTPAAVSFSYLSRAMGQEGGGPSMITEYRGGEGDIPSYWTANIISVLYAWVTTQEQATFTYSAYAVGCPVSYSTPFTDSGHQIRRFSSVAPNVFGVNVWVGIEGATVTETSISAVALEIAEGNPSNL
jgi:hypothetical protein